MSEESQDSWGLVGEAVPVVPSLIRRIALHSPEVVAQLQRHLELNGEPLDARTTYDGADPSARLSLLLVEALIAFEQLRLEMMDQQYLAQGRPLPVHLMQAMSEVSALEPALMQVSKTAFETHLKIWNAHAGAVRVPRKSKGLGKGRGRWRRRKTDKDAT